jgi:predicted Zn-dependent protease
VPVGRVDAQELETALARAGKTLHRAFELREGLGVPHDTEDHERRQHRAAALIERLVAEARKLAPGRLVGGDTEAKAPPQPGGLIFVTDVDLYTARSEGVVAALVPARRSAVISLRRLREAFHGRRTDPQRQRERLIKELLRMAGRLAGAPECNNPACALAPSKSLPDIDAKEERYCRACEQRLFEGTLRI